MGEGVPAVSLSSEDLSCFSLYCLSVGHWLIDMKLTPAKELSRGLWFARQVTGEEDLGRGPWSIAVIMGDFPFLYGRAYFYENDSEERRVDRMLRYEGEIDNPNEWEFGEKIEFPTED